MKKKLDKVTRAMVRKAVLYLLDKYNIPYETPVTAQNAVQIASQLYAEGILTAEMLVEINLSLEMLSELTLNSTLDTQANLILNTVTGSTAAYSLRQINANYTGPLIRVRRDSQEFDVGISNLNLDTAYLQSLITQGENYLRYSENFSFWTVTGLTMAENQPFLNGINTARTFYPTATTGLHRIVSTSTNFLGSSQYIPSGYIKSLGHRFIQIGLGTQQNIPDVSLRFLTVDCIERKIVTDSANGSGRIELLNDGWFRVWLTIPAAGVASSNNYTINLLDNTYSSSYSGDPSKGIAVYGAQINTVGIQPYVPITDTNTTTGSNLFVTTIYDQSGNNYHLTQITAANQPQLVINGAINRVNGKPAILFDGSNDWFRTVFSIGSSFTRYFVGSHLGSTAGGTIMLDDGFTPDRAYLVMSGPTTLRLYAGSNLYYSGITNDSQFITYNLFNATNSEAAVNNVPLVTGSVSSSATTYSGVTIGSRGGSTPGYYANFNFQELIIYSGNQSATRTVMMNNLNQYYQTYWDGSEQKLLDQYPNAAAAYSLRNLNSAYTGPLIRVRRATDSIELDIYGKYDGTLDTQSLTSFGASTNCFVRTWYDQANSARNVVQTTNANQPTIVSNGIISSVSNKPSILFDGTNDVMFGPNVSLMATVSTYTMFFIANVNQITTNLNIGYDNATIVGETGGGFGSALRNNPNRFFAYNFDTGQDSVSINISLNQTLLFYQAHYGNNLYASINNTADVFTPSNNTWDLNYPLKFGQAVNSAPYYNGYLHEMIIYNTNRSSNKPEILSNINSFYQIY